MKSLRGILAIIALLVPLTSEAVPQAPPPNPVFVNDSSEAARLLARARDIADTNPAETIRLVQQVLDDHQYMLVPDPTEPGRFQSVRHLAQDILRSNEVLLDRYETAESNQANRMLEQGRLRRLVETRPLTRAGLEALLLLGQENLEAGRLAVATTWLEEATSHPQLSDQDRWATWLMLAMASHGRGDLGGLADLSNRLSEAGPEAAPWSEALASWTAQEAPRPEHGQDMLDTAPSRVGDLLAPALWESSYQRTPSSILARNEISDDLIEETIQSGKLTAVVPTIAGEHIFFNEGADVVRMDLYTGLEDWRTSILETAARAERVDEPIGPTAVAVDGDDIVTWIGYSMEGGTSESEEIVCLDATTGEERWRFDLVNTPGIDDPQALYPAGPAVIHEDRVFVLTRRERRQGLKSCYLLALNRDDGTPAFVSYIASTGSQYREGSLRPLTMPVIDGDQVLVASSIGAIASVDVASGRVKWVQRMDTPVSGTRAKSRVRPYHVHLPLVLEDRVISLSPDFRHVVSMDRKTGHRTSIMSIEDRPEWKAASYLLTDGQRIFVVGASVSSLDPDNMAAPLWTTWPQAKGQGMSLAGRVHLAGDRLYVPTGSTITEIDIETGDVTQRLPISGSSLPLVVDGHLLVGGPSGIALHADKASITSVLEERLHTKPNAPGTHLALVRVAARSNDRPLLLKRASESMAMLVEETELVPGEKEGVRRAIFEEIRSTLDPSERIANRDYRDIQKVLDELTSGTSLEASATLALGDWMAESDLPLAVSHWRRVETDPVLSNTMHEEVDILAPAGAWARRRLTTAARTYPELVPPPPWQQLDPQAPWERRLATHAENLRSQRDTDRLARETARMLEESLQINQAQQGLALLDLWLNTQGHPSSPLGDALPAQWRQQLVNAAYPVIPRHTAVGGQALDWPGQLVEPLYEEREPALSQHAFLRSHDDRLTWHVAPDYTPSWTTYLTHREATIVYQDDLVIVIQLSQLGRPARLVSLATADGRVHWDVELPGTLFEPQESTETSGEDEGLSGLASTGWVAIEPIGDRILLLHQDGRCAAIDAKEDAAIQWRTSLPGHVVQDHAPWHHGVAILGYRQSIVGDAWIDRSLERGDMILAWIDAEHGDIEMIDIPSELGVALWLRSNSLGDLIVGGSNGAALFRRPGHGPDWISLDRSLQAMRMREGTRITPQALLVTDLQYKMHPISLDTGRELATTHDALQPETSSLPKLTSSGDRLWLLYDKSLQILDTKGGLIGSDATSRTQNHRFDAIAPYADGLILVDQVSGQSNRHQNAHLASSGHLYKLHILLPGGRAVEGIDLFDLDSRIRTARAVEGMLLLSTDEKIFTLQLPPLLQQSTP
ncbi:MAG: PQQ-binding-like beta-propeller repeat protein [Planctomycetota bacterium]|nr:PQQ-binding-like beta-propeller repeat protein [Planctomycetota bacterium]